MQEKETIMVCSVRVGNSVARDICSPSLGKHHDAEQLPFMTEFSILTSQPINMLKTALRCNTRRRFRATTRHFTSAAVKKVLKMESF